MLMYQDMKPERSESISGIIRSSDLNAANRIKLSNLIKNHPGLDENLIFDSFLEHNYNFAETDVFFSPVSLFFLLFIIFFIWTFKKSNQ